MTTKLFTILAIAVAIMSSCGLTGASAAVGLVDDYDTAGLLDYDLYKILDQGDGTTNISFSDAAGTIDVTSTGTSGAEQVLFFRNDGISIEQGEQLRLDAPTTFINRDFGLAIGETPTGLADGADGDVRSATDYLFISWRTLGFLNSRGFNNNGEIGLAQASVTSADSLFIARLGNDDIELGSYSGSVRTVLQTVTPATLDVFDNVGFYADIRGDGDGFAGADNLRIEAIPEPTTLMLVGLGLVGAMATRRRS